MQFDQFQETIQQNHIAQIICLICQLLLTIHTCINLNKNKKSFPVKQLSPLLSLFALISFFITNSISFIAKIIQKQNNYYNSDFQGQKCGQCRLYQHNQMIILAFIYNAFRQLPLILFIIKTYRVCLCYEKDFSKKLSNKVISLFSSERKLLILSLLITCIYVVTGYLVFNQGTPYNGMLIFQFFCPKQSSVFDWILNVLRFLLMAYIYVICIYSYSELDFKKFLILIFILTNTQVILRLFLVIASINETTYHQFYYHSFFMNLFGTILMFFYSKIKEARNSPVQAPILQKFSNFFQSYLGCSVIYYYAKYLDQQQKNKQILKQNTHQQIFNAKIDIGQIIIRSQNNLIEQDQSFDRIQQILKSISILNRLRDYQELVNLCKQKKLTIKKLKLIEDQIDRFFQLYVYNQWKKTVSYQFLKKQLQNNCVINIRMSDLKISL